jgi:hypothetical protein
MSQTTKQKRASKTRTSEAPTRKMQVDLLRQAMAWVLNDRIFADLKMHGNVKWSAKFLIILAVMMAWSESKQLTEAFKKAASLSERLYGTVAIATYQGLMRALVTHGPLLLPRMWSRLQTLMERAAPEHYRIGGWVPLAVDGSRFTTPRTQSNEKSFAAQQFGKGKKARSRRKWKNKKKRTKKLCTPVKPQIWLTLVWHMGLKLPWCWKSGPSTSSERHDLIDMLKSHAFPKKTLFCCDAGFVGYELWSSIIGLGHSFLIRVGGNVRLLKNLGHVRTGEGIVYLWPNEAARKQQAPIVLRLIEVKASKGSMFLVTNVLNKRQLSDAALKKLYPLRWGVELQFRAAKQTFGRSKLRCRNSDHALAELDWSLVALSLVQLFAIREQSRLEEPPENMSVALALKAIRHAMEQWNEPANGATKLNLQLKAATLDSYKRSSDKRARYQPSFKDKPSATKPIIQNATAIQKRNYTELSLPP